MSKAFHEFDGTSSARCPFHYQFQYVPVCSSIDTCRTMKFLQIERSSTDGRRWTPPVLGN